MAAILSLEYAAIAISLKYRFVIKNYLILMA